MRPLRIRSRSAVAVGGALVLAAALSLLLRWGAASTRIPVYGLEAGNGDAGSVNPAVPLVLGPGGRLELVARPVTAPGGTIGARSYFVQGEVVRPWVPTLEISEDGVVRVTAGSAAWSNLAPGRWEVVVMVARPADLPSDASQARRVIASPDDGTVRVLRWTVEVR